MGNLTYDQKKAIADKYIAFKAGGLGWDDLPDINSLHDVQTEEDIHCLCDERINDENPFDSLLD